jgi:1-acyl-sn-glycerol-3-phosphate acyltransferase
LAWEVGCKIYPVGIVGTSEIQPPDTRLPKPFRACSIRVGPPVDPAAYTAPDSDPESLRAITDEVMRRIQLLTGQEYHDVYAGQAGSLDGRE